MAVRAVALVIVRSMLGLVGLGPTPDATDVEIAVLRHQLMVLRRQVARPHRGINLAVPVPVPAPHTAARRTKPAGHGHIQRIDVLSGLIHEYRRAA